MENLIRVLKYLLAVNELTLINLKVFVVPTVVNWGQTHPRVVVSAFFVVIVLWVLRRRSTRSKRLETLWWELNISLGGDEFLEQDIAKLEEKIQKRKEPVVDDSKTYSVFDMASALMDITGRVLVSLEQLEKELERVQKKLQKQRDERKRVQRKMDRLNNWFHRLFG